MSCLDSLSPYSSSLLTLRRCYLQGMLFSSWRLEILTDSCARVHQCLSSFIYVERRRQINIHINSLRLKSFFTRRVQGDRYHVNLFLMKPGHTIKIINRFSNICWLSQYFPLQAQENGTDIMFFLIIIKRGADSRNNSPKSQPQYLDPQYTPPPI